MHSHIYINLTILIPGYLFILMSVGTQLWITIHYASIPVYVWVVDYMLWISNSIAPPSCLSEHTLIIAHTRYANSVWYTVHGLLVNCQYLVNIKFLSHSTETCTHLIINPMGIIRNLANYGYIIVSQSNMYIVHIMRRFDMEQLI